LLVCGERADHCLLTIYPELFTFFLVLLAPCGAGALPFPLVLTLPHLIALFYFLLFSVALTIFFFYPSLYIYPELFTFFSTIKLCTSTTTTTVCFHHRRKSEGRWMERKLRKGLRG